MDKDAMKNKLKGNVNQAVGSTREKVGAAVGNENLKQKGALQHARGDGQEAVGDVQDAANDATNKLKDGVEAAADKAKKAVGR